MRRPSIPLSPNRPVIWIVGDRNALVGRPGGAPASATRRATACSFWRASEQTRTFGHAWREGPTSSAPWARVSDPQMCLSCGASFGTAGDVSRPRDRGVKPGREARFPRICPDAAHVSGPWSLVAARRFPVKSCGIPFQNIRSVRCNIYSDVYFDPRSRRACRANAKATGARRPDSQPGMDEKRDTFMVRVPVARRERCRRTPLQGARGVQR